MFDSLNNGLLELAQKIISSNSFFTEMFPVMVKYISPLLCILILFGTILSLLNLPKKPEVWAKLVSVQTGKNYFIYHWENILGSHKSSDIVIGSSKVARQHAALIRNKKGEWRIYEIGASRGISINGDEVIDDEAVNYGDVISLADFDLRLEPLTSAEKKSREKKRRRIRPIPALPMLILLTVFQFMSAFTLIINRGENASPNIIPAFAILTIAMWLYYVDMRIMGIKGFEMEIIAFFLSTLSLSLVGSNSPSTLIKQAISVLLGIAFLISFGIFLRNIQRVKTFRWIMAGATLILLALPLLFGDEIYGARNWITIKGVSFQTSEIAKITYIFAGSATLDRMFNKRNIALFIALTMGCIGILALSNDYGTAAIFFITFIIIAYLRSGSMATIAFIGSGAFIGGLLLVTAKPHIFSRFSSWGHAWDYAGTTGYQMINTQVAINSGRVFGVGAGNGNLAAKHVAAADKDLVFGMLCEEWGILIALLAIGCILTLAVFSIISCTNSRSSYYTIAACSATSLLLFQTALNVFGSVDLLPLTGVTFPFISNGGSSMIMAWGSLAFLKATDTRKNASFATGLKRHEQALTFKDLKIREEKYNEKDS